MLQFLDIFLFLNLSYSQSSTSGGGMVGVSWCFLCKWKFRTRCLLVSIVTRGLSQRHGHSMPVLDLGLPGSLILRLPLSLSIFWSASAPELRAPGWQGVSLAYTCILRVGLSARYTADVCEWMIKYRIYQDLGCPVICLPQCCHFCLLEGQSMIGYTYYKCGLEIGWTWVQVLLPPHTDFETLTSPWNYSGLNFSLSFCEH